MANERQKNMIDNNAYISAMASNLHQEWWPPIYVNNDGLNEEVLAMVFVAHNAHKHLVWKKGNLAKELGWRIVNLWWKNVGDGDCQRGNVNKGTSLGSDDGVLGIHRHALVKNDA
jgi:hypothetical protein